MGDDHFVERLAAYDEALRHGTPTEGDASVARDPRLARAKECVELLNRVWGTASACDDSTNPTSTINPQFESLIKSGLAVGDDLNRADVLAQPIESGQRFGRFEIIRLVGQGGSGLVFLARDTQLGRHVALKLPRAETLLAPELRRRFLLETKAAAALSHPNIVPLYEAGTVGPVCYIASEYCPGPTMAEWLSLGEAVPIRLAAEWVKQLAEAMHHAHQRGVLHRDLKPGNVLLVPTDTAGESTAADARFFNLEDATDLVPRITDFGLAKLESQEGAATRTGTFLGTVAYMAPEQVEGRINECDRRTDVYGLGAILYELLTGQPPFRAATDVATLLAIRQHDLIAPRKLRSDVPADLDAICATALEKQPDHRYSTAADLAADLRRFLAGEPTIVRPLGRIKRTGRWVSRHRLAAALIAVVTLSLISFAVGGMWHAAQLRNELAISDELRLQGQSRERSLQEAMYAADVRLANSALIDKDVTRAADLLARHIPSQNEPDYRDFEWYFLNAMASCQYRSIDTVDAAIYGLALSSDQKRLAIVDEKSRLHVYEWPSGRRITTMPTGQMKGRSVAFSDDSQTIAIAGDDGTLKLWKDEKLIETFSPHSGKRVRGVTYSAPAHTWVTCGEDGSICRLDNYTQFDKPQPGETFNPPRMVAAARHKPLIAAVARDGIVRVYDLTKNDNVFSQQNAAGWLCATFSPYDDILAVGTYIGDVARWHTSKWQELTGLEPISTVSCLSYSADGRHLAAGNTSGAMYVWEFDTADSVSNTRPKLVALWGAHNALVSGLSFADNNELVSAGVDGKLVAWKPLGQQVYDRSLQLEEGLSEIAPLCKEPLVVARMDNVLDVIDVRTGATVKRLARNPQKTASWISVSAAVEKSTVVAAQKDGTVSIWQNWKENAAPTEQLEFGSALIDATISPDGSLLLLQFAGRIRPILLELETGKCYTQLAEGDGCSVARFSRDSRWLALGEHGSNDILLWDIQRKELRHRFHYYRDTINALDFSPDAEQLAVQSGASSVSLWNCSSGKVIWATTSTAIDRRRFPPSIAFTPAGRSVVCSDSSGLLQVWQAATGREVANLSEYNHYLKSIAFCDRGNFLCGVYNERLLVIDRNRKVEQAH